MQIVRYSKVWISISALLVIGSFALVGVFGLRLSADFVEGTLYELKFGEDVTQLAIVGSVAPFSDEMGNVSVTETWSGTFILRFKRVDDAVLERFVGQLSQDLGAFDVIQERQVSPTFAETFRQRAIIAVLAASVMIILYVAFAFRKVSKGIKSWKLGMCAVIALVHDVSITVGAFVLFGLFFGVEVDSLFITALLAVMGYSVNDTIVVFDRIRENVLKHIFMKSFGEIVNDSLNQTMSRSINTSLSTLLVLIAMLIAGSPEIFWFVAALTIGIGIGTYSSIFLASPLLVLWKGRP